MMQVKIFMDSGKAGVENVEKQVNRWLNENDGHVNVLNTQTAMCQVTDAPDSERWQCLAITIWYEEV